MSNPRFDRLVAKLRELFQLDQPELDFGIYRILHARSDEITAFLENDLLPQVKDALATYQPADKAALQAELDEAIAQATSLGADPDSLPKVRELRERLENEAVDLGALEAEVYDHLYRFFSRYYHEGDFISLRRYKEGVYAIPYEGEEVKLYWANHDQYYIKTAEYLRDYAFRLRPDDDADPMRVHFRLVDAAEGEHGNVKEAEGKKRVFVLAADDFIAEEPGEGGVSELVLRFEYRPATIADWPEALREGKDKPPSQKDLLDAAVERVEAVSDPSLARWIRALSEKHIKADGSRADYSRLRAHLDRYTARNTFDYFIHKDLGGFLRRELDFYIKSEVMRLDDIEDETAPRVEQYLSKIKVIRRIALKIIEFLAQLEDFQKKLWLKKKFVTETSWCVSIATILGIEDAATRKELLAEVAANDAQRAEWVALHGIDKLQPDLERPAYSEPLTPEFVVAYPTLMIDTRHFERAFVERLLEAIGDIDELTDGVLFQSENFQALSLMRARYREQVKCIYIDPPYNTGDDGFVYKDSYQHSSWASMMVDRLGASRALQAGDGVIFSSIDDHESESLKYLMASILGARNFLAQLIWDKQHSQQQGIFKRYHEYVIAFAREVSQLRGITGGGGFIEAGALKKISKANPASDFTFPAGVRFDAPDGTVLSGTFGGSETVRVVRGRFEARGGRTTEEITLNAGWTQKAQMTSWFSGQPTVDSKGQRVVEFYFNAAGKLKCRKERSVITPPSLLPRYGMVSEQTAQLVSIMGKHTFDRPKPVRLVADLAGWFTPAGGLALDYFAGSGTTGHAVINLNREDGGSRKFILLEMDQYFDTVLVPRLKKVTFAPEWKDGRPKRLCTPEEAERSPRVFKIVRLESYEDTLNNLELKRSDSQQSLLDAPVASGAGGLKEQYFLSYLLDVESRGSASLLNVEQFIDPRAYTLKVKRPGSDETREVAVDLLETFNWLLGLRVRHIAAPQSFSAAFKRDDEGRLRLDGRLKPEADGSWWFRTVTGEAPDGRRVLVIWRTRPGGDDVQGIEQDNLVLDEWFTRQGYSAKDSEFDLIYVNGDNNLENLKGVDDRWKVRLIEEEFFRLMFDVEDV